MTEATEDAVETTEFWIGSVAKETTWDNLEAYMKTKGATLKKLRRKAKQPWAIVSVPDDKADVFQSETHEVDGATLELDPVWKTIRYFIDTRTTKGSLGDLSEETVKEYFSTFGEVAKLNIMEAKGFGFLEMKLEEGNEAVEGLAWKTHEIDGHVLNVKEQERKRKRKWKGKGGRKRKWKSGKKGWKKKKWQKKN